jgi:protein TonB
MTAITYSSLALSWHSDNRDRFFNIMAVIAVIVLMIIETALTLVQLPKADRNAQLVVPERIAQYMLEMPKVEPRVEPPPPPPKPKNEDRIERPAPTEQKALTRADQQARKNVEGKGLLAMSKELSALADASRVSTQVVQKLNTAAPASTAAPKVDTGILTSSTGTRTVAISQAAHVGTVGNTTLSDNQRQVAQNMLAASEGNTAGKNTGAGTGAGTTGRGEGANARRFEDVAVVMDQNKSVLYTLYNRARRSNPGIKGKIVLVLTISPAGQVTNIKVQSSELGMPDLEASIVERVRQFDFGKRTGGALTVTIPVEFLP